MTYFGSIAGKPAKDYRDDYNNRTIHMARGAGVEYRGYTIQEKRDFGDCGHFISGQYVKHGYVVTDGGIINEMPAATWFLTVEAAMRAIDDLIASRDLTPAGAEHPFWALNRFRGNCEERAPELALLLQQVMDESRNFISPDLQSRVDALLDRIDDNCDMRTTVVQVDKSRTRQGERHTGRFGVMPR